MYGRKIGPKMSALLEQIRAKPDYLDVSEELEQARIIHAERWQLYAFTFETMPDGEARQTALHIAGQMVDQSLDNLTKLIERASRIMSAKTNGIGPQCADAIVRQMCGFVYQCFDSEKDRTNIMKFDKMLSEKLELPSLKSLGTSRTPSDSIDAQVMAMDDTVPYAPVPDINGAIAGV